MKAEKFIQQNLLAKTSRHRMRSGNVSIEDFDKWSRGADNNLRNGLEDAT